jgi:sulfite oxidase
MYDGLDPAVSRIHANKCNSYSVNTSKPLTAQRLKMYEDRGVSFLPLTRPAPFDLETDEEYLEEMKRREGRDPIE